MSNLLLRTLHVDHKDERMKIITKKFLSVQVGRFSFKVAPSLNDAGELELIINATAHSASR